MHWLPHTREEAYGVHVMYPMDFLVFWYCSYCISEFKLVNVVSEVLE